MGVLFEASKNYEIGYNQNRVPVFELALLVVRYRQSKTGNEIEPITTKETGILM